jgi:hypothetical protein
MRAFNQRPLEEGHVLRQEQKPERDHPESPRLPEKPEAIFEAWVRKAKENCCLGSKVSPFVFPEAKH